MLLCANGLGQFSICSVADFALREVEILEEIAQNLDDNYSYMDNNRIP